MNRNHILYIFKNNIQMNWIYNIYIYNFKNKLGYKMARINVNFNQ